MQDNVIREFTPIGKYRVRLLRSRENPDAVVLDIREYLKIQDFEGFTRRGIRITCPEDLSLLRSVLREAYDIWSNIPSGKKV